MKTVLSVDRVSTDKDFVIWLAGTLACFFVWHGKNMELKWMKTLKYYGTKRWHLFHPVYENRRPSTLTTLLVSVLGLRTSPRFSSYRIQHLGKKRPDEKCYSNSWTQRTACFRLHLRGPMLLWQQLVPGDLMGTSWLVRSSCIAQQLIGYPPFKLDVFGN